MTNVETPTRKARDEFKQPIWRRRYAAEIAISIGGLVAVNLVFISKAFRATDTVNPVGAGQLGDFVGGFVGTYFALVSVVLLFATLRQQRATHQRQHFENKYFELIKMHRDNVAELQLQEASGRRIFVLLVREFRSIVRYVQKTASDCNQKLTQRELIRLAYFCLFFGVGPNSSRMLRSSLSDFNAGFIKAIEAALEDPKNQADTRQRRKLAYVPFQGHQSRLGHYYRHLYQTVRYVDCQQPHVDKYEYVKTIRAQLSTHEQALLLINSLTPLGQDWWLNDLIVKYRMVQNLPKHFLDSETELNLDQLFAKGYFEWEEAEARQSEADKQTSNLDQT